MHFIMTHTFTCILGGLFRNMIVRWVELKSLNVFDYTMVRNGQKKKKNTKQENKPTSVLVLIILLVCNLGSNLSKNVFK